MSIAAILRRRQNYREAASTSFTFSFAGNASGYYDNSYGPWVNMMENFRGYGTVADPVRNSVNRPALDATDRHPTEDFGVTFSAHKQSASALTLKGKLLGLGTITKFSGTGYTLANIVPSGDDTTFDVQIAAGTNPNSNQLVITVTNSKRTAASATNTGCRGLILKEDGFSLADTTVVMPDYKASWGPIIDTIRFMDLAFTNVALHIVNPADRPKPGIQGLDIGLSGTSDPRRVSLESCISMANEMDKNMWWCIPARASDALITEMAGVVRDNLAVGKTCMFELGNENWNTAFVATVYWIDQAMQAVDGYSAQFSSNTWNKAYLASCTSNVVTVKFQFPHGMSIGDTVVVSGINTAASGTKTVASVPDSQTITWAETLANFATTDIVSTSTARWGRGIVSGTRTSNVVTVVFRNAHGWGGAGATKTIWVIGMGLDGSVTATVVNSTTITFPSVGTDGNAITNLGGTSIVGNPTSDPLRAPDSSYDQYVLARRYYAKRTCEMSTLIQSAFGSGFGTRYQVGLFNQPSDIQNGQLDYINASLGAPNTFLTHVGNATYAFLDATPFGGSNLQNTATTVANYVGAWTLTLDGAKTSALDNYDGHAFYAAWYGLKMAQYEFGPDAAGISNLNKIDALFDSSFKAPYRQLLDNLEDHGYEMVAAYHLGTAPAGTTSPLSCWGLFRDYAGTSSVRVDAITEKIAATRTGPRRNLVNATGVTNIDSRNYTGNYTISGAYPNVGPTRRSWVISSPVAGTFLFEPTFDSTTVTEVRLYVNGPTQIGSDIPVPIATGTTPTGTVITLRKGINALRLGVGDLALTNIQCTNLKFTKV